MQPFDTKIHKVINKFSYPVWFIVKDPKILCPCVDFTTKVPDRNCTKCFGLGTKIKIYHVKAARSYNKDIRLRGVGIGFNEIDPGNVYYTIENTGIKESDVIVDRDEASVVKEAFSEHSNQNNSVYWKINTVPMKDHDSDFKENFFGYLKEAKKV